MNRWSSATPWATCAATLCLLAACSGQSNDVAPVSFDDPPASVATTTAPTTTVAPSSSVAASTTAAAAAATTTSALAEGDALTGPTFSDALGIRVDTAPGVRTRGDTRQLTPDGLYVHIAWEPDPDDPSVFTVQHDDIDILEAYTNAVRVFYEAATTDLVIDPTAFAPYMADSGAQFAESLMDASAGGYVDSLGSGVILRPYVPADSSTADEATVLDCTRTNEQFVLRGSTRQPGELVNRGQLATMVRVDGVWKVDVFAEEPAACL